MTRRHRHHNAKRINWTKAEEIRKEKRKKLTQLKEALSKEQGGICPICEDPLGDLDACDVDHKKRLADGGTNERPNLQVIHKEPCHRQKSAQELRIEGHVRRVRKRFEGEHKPKGTIKSRGFQGSRPFPKKGDLKPKEPSYWG